MDVIRSRTVVARVGADIGKQQDPTAIVVTEEQDRDGVDHFVTRMVERLPLGTSYLAAADRIVEVARNLEARSASLAWVGDEFHVETWVDATGVGLPVIDLIREQGVNAKAAIFTGTDKLTEHPGNAVSIGKGYMVSRLQVLLQANRLHLPITAEVAALVKELQNYQITVSERAHASFNAPSGKHDDLVIALGLSVGPGGRAGKGWSGTWLPDVEKDDWRHPDHVPPWARERAS